MKTPFLLRSLFAVAVVAVFVWSMFPMTQTDFYDTFRSISQNADDPELVSLIDDAKAKQKADIKEYPYPSKAIDAAANDKGGVELKKFLPENVIKNSKIKTNADVISMIRKRSAGALHLGIDLNGGAEFMLELTPVGEDAEKDFEKFRDNAIETIRKRLEAQNYLECEIAPAGGKLISVRVPTISDDEKAKLEQLILRSAKLEFRLAYPDYNELGRILNDIDVAHDAYNAENPKKLLTKEKFYAEVYRPAHANLADYDLLYTLEDNGKRNYDLISTKVEMTGSGVKNAMVGYTQFGQREIQLEFNGEGANQFGKITTANVGKRLGIVLDGQLYSAPNLNEPILGGRAQITGTFSEDEAKGVADALVSGSMPFDITVVSRADIDPTVGSDTIQKSIWSGIIGTILVMIFMIIYYRLAGVIANISLVVNAFVMLGAIAAFDVTLTLPGIAGIVLTIGMAVDANVLIYERIREELNNGKSLANAVNIGFSNAFSAIFDSNMTTLFVALILFWQGSGAIKSFAITLAIGIFTTLFTAVFLTRLLFDLLLKICGNRLKTLSMMQFCKNPKINFLGMKKITLSLSVVLVIGSLILIGVKNSDILGIDFTGGSRLIVSYEGKTETAQRVEVAAIEQYLKDNGYNARASYKTTEEGKEQLEIVLRGEVDKDTGAKIIEDMDKAYPDVKFDIKEQTELGALIGAEFTKSAIIALVLAMIGMIIYMIIRFQLSYSIAANVALIHDVIVSLGIYLAFGGQLTLNVVAGLLTLIGYSVNDTIVTFDRQRENLTLMRGASYKDIVNTSINQTLGRTILTSTSVLLILIAQLIWGGDGIKDFISVMLIGCIVGCYSSIFISPTITAYWHKRERNVSEADQTVENTNN